MWQIWFAPWAGLSTGDDMDGLSAASQAAGAGWGRTRARSTRSNRRQPWRGRRYDLRRWAGGSDSWGAAFCESVVGKSTRMRGGRQTRQNSKRGEVRCRAGDRSDGEEKRVVMAGGFACVGLACKQLLNQAGREAWKGHRTGRTGKAKVCAAGGTMLIGRAQAPAGRTLKGDRVQGWLIGAGRGWQEAAGAGVGASTVTGRSRAPNSHRHPKRRAMAAALHPCAHLIDRALSVLCQWQVRGAVVRRETRGRT
jgi:hypothetical protein